MTPLPAINYSVIIPHKGIPELLVRCLESIPERDDIQVIVVDDNSEDADTYAEKYPRLNRPGTEIIFTKEGKGAGYARNIGLKHAKGKWVLFADADDFFLPGWLTVTDRFLDSDADVIQFRIEDIVDKGSRNWHNGALDKYRKGTLSARDVLFTDATCWAKMLRASFLETNWIRCEEVRYANDVSFGFQVAVNAASIVICQSAIYDVTYREGSLTTVRNAESLRTRYSVQKRADAYAFAHGFKRFELPCAMEFLKAWRKHGVKAFLSFFWQERKEIGRSRMIRMENKPFNYRHPYLYSLMVLFKLF